MSNPDVRVWDDMLSHLRLQHPGICRQWFEDLEPAGISGGAFHIRTHSVLHRDYLRRQCADAFNDAARSASGRLISVRFLGPDEPAEPARPRTATAGRDASEPLRASVPSTSEAAAPSTPPPGRDADQGSRARTLEPKPFQRERRADSLVINPDYSFESFVVGPGNRLAHAAAKAVGAKPGKAYNPYFIHGDVGLGKTHLLQAICLELAANNPNLDMYYLSCESFLTQFMESVQSGHMEDFRHRFRDVDVLVIDDIHFLAKRDRTQEEFFHTFNSLFQAEKQIILSSDAPPEEIPDLEARLVSRFKWGLVAKIEPPCYETRVAIILAKARTRGITIPDAVAQYIAARIDSNIRELEGAITKLHIQSVVESRSIDLDLARAALGDLPIDLAGEPTIQAIMAVVTEFFGVRTTDLQSKRRQRSVALPRQVCMHLARRLTRMSLEEIGGYFGGRDHTTVMHGVKTIDSRRSSDADFDSSVKSLEEKLRPTRAS